MSENVPLKSMLPVRPVNSMSTGSFFWGSTQTVMSWPCSLTRKPRARTSPMTFSPTGSLSFPASRRMSSITMAAASRFGAGPPPCPGGSSSSIADLSVGLRTRILPWIKSMMETPAAAGSGSLRTSPGTL